MGGIPAVESCIKVAFGAQLAAGLAEHERLHQEVAAQSSSSANEAAMLQARCAALAQQLASKEALLQTAVASVEAEAEAHASEHTELRKRLNAAKVTSGPFFSDSSLKTTWTLRIVPLYGRSNCCVWCPRFLLLSKVTMFFVNCRCAAGSSVTKCVGAG